MLYHLLLFCFIICTPAIKTTPLFADSLEQTPLGCTLTDRFAPLAQLSGHSLPTHYHSQFVPYLMARGVNDRTTIEALLHEDLLHIAQALHILFEQDSTRVLQNFLGDHFSLIEGYSTQIDHVGRELFGPLSFYIPLLDQNASQFGLSHLRNLIFPSTQVVKVLQEHDPHLAGVTVGRIYFQNMDDGKIKCLELFQAAPQDEKSPQNIAATKERLSLLTAFKSDSLLTPIDHLSIELSTVEEVECVHHRIQQQSTETLKPYQKDISHNSADGSTQTKALIRDSKEAPYNRIIEFVHYNK